MGYWQRAKSIEPRELFSLPFALCHLRYALCPMLCALCSLLFTSLSQAQAVINTGSIVTFDYTLSVNGQVMESTDGKEPIKYMQGQGTLVPGLEKALLGMKGGEEKIITVPPAE